jgi:hypothetical protein
MARFTDLTGPPGAAASGVTGGAPGLAGGVGGTVPPVGVSFNLYGLPVAQATFGVSATHFSIVWRSGMRAVLVDTCW